MQGPSSAACCCYNCAFSRVPRPPACPLLLLQILLTLGFEGKQLWEPFVGLLCLAVSGRGLLCVLQCSAVPQAPAFFAMHCPLPHSMYLPCSLQFGFNLLGYLLLRFTKPRYLPLTATPAKKAA